MSISSHKTEEVYPHQNSTTQCSPMAATSKANCSESTKKRLACRNPAVNSLGKVCVNSPLRRLLGRRVVPPNIRRLCQQTKDSHRGSMNTIHCKLQCQTTKEPLACSTCLHPKLSSRDTHPPRQLAFSQGALVCTICIQSQHSTSTACTKL